MDWRPGVEVRVAVPDVPELDGLTGVMIGAQQPFEDEGRTFLPVRMDSPPVGTRPLHFLWDEILEAT